MLKIEDLIKLPRAKIIKSTLFAGNCLQCGKYVKFNLISRGNNHGASIRICDVGCNKINNCNYNNRWIMCVGCVPDWVIKCSYYKNIDYYIAKGHKCPMCSSYHGD